MQLVLEDPIPRDDANAWQMRNEVPVLDAK
jgi:hypothetical protein